MLVQLVLLVDFAHSWNESWVAKMEEGSKCYFYGEGLVDNLINIFYLEFTDGVSFSPI